MPSPSPDSALPDLTPLRTQAAAEGLDRLWTVPRAAVDAACADLPAALPRPATLRTDYRTCLVIGSSGPALWRRLVQRSATDGPDPVDRHAERTVEALAAALRAADPAVLPLYPFRHERQFLGFPRLLGLPAWLGPAPFGVLIHPKLGPWWALRGALLTALEWPDAPGPDAGAESPCVPCPAPCVSACPAGAVHKAGIDGAACADFRLSGPTCAETCLARLACPVAPRLRYDGAAIAHHYRASLRELAAMRR